MYKQHFALRYLIIIFIDWCAYIGLVFSCHQMLSKVREKRLYETWGYKQRKAFKRFSPVSLFFFFIFDKQYSRASTHVHVHSVVLKHFVGFVGGIPIFPALPLAFSYATHKHTHTHIHIYLFRYLFRQVSDKLIFDNILNKTLGPTRICYIFSVHCSIFMLSSLYTSGKHKQTLYISV